MSVGDITDCATSTAYTVLLRFTPEDKVYKCKFVWNQVVGRVKSENLATHPPLSLGPGEFSYGQCFRLKKTNLHFIKLVLSLEYTVQYMYIYIFCNFFVFLFVSIGACTQFSMGIRTLTLPTLTRSVPCEAPCFKRKQNYPGKLC